MKPVDWMRTDGRDISPQLGLLEGEGALQETGPQEEHVEKISEDSKKILAPDDADPTYYDRPLLKEPVWEWHVPAYYFVGGAAGAALVMGAAAQFDGSPGLKTFVRRCHAAGILGSMISGGLLIYDLGRPARFHHMLRVFRPTSPMNVGVWILSAVAPSAIMASLFHGRRGLLGAFGEISGIASGLAGLGLATYTGVLVSNTAVPVWQESRRVLPILFGASAMASAGSLFDFLVEDRQARRITYTFGTIGRVAELASSIVMERQAGRVEERVARPLQRGVSGTLWKTATALTAGSLLLSVLPGKSRKKRIATGILGLAGSLCLRFGTHYAGVASARDARASFRLQRAEHTSPARAAPPLPENRA
ncbi:MAG TPA: NrfD/PsrC family molybdoenzyme membrane anchor subunit [Bryobacteraceae bacterium]|nr:NrfD/PsrC family molybdoenzyme membrane anchor subunit [Bryobacteraceae bacterium]